MATRQKKYMSEDLERLIKSIGDCKSKSEEDRIVSRAMEATKATIKNGSVDKNRTKDFLVKLIYFEMLGHDSTFGHFLAVQACGSNSVPTKLVGYLAVSQFLDSSDSLILLLVNTWRSDLQNENHVIVCAALTAICKLVNGDAIGALVSQVITLLSHPKEIVRKKAVLAMQRFCQVDPLHEGGLAGTDTGSLLGHALCDPDPAVMSATLCGLYEVIKLDPAPFRRLIPSLTSIIKQVTSHRLSKSYEYHHCPAPFIQIRLLRVLALLGAGDKPSTDNMKNVLLTVLRNANPRNTIGYAVLFECIRTMTTISPDTQLLEEAARAIFTFLRPDNSHNLKYMGLDALGGIVAINFRQAQEHQTAVMDCLEDPDDTLKLKTLELLYKMTKATNVEIVVEKLIQYLKTCTDEHIQHNICRKVTDLAERYAPDTLWYVETMIEMFEAAGDTAPKESEQELLRLITEQDNELHVAVVQLCMRLLGRPKLPKNLIYVICWILGEYGCLVDEIPEENMNSVDIQDSLCELIQASEQDEVVQGYILAAVCKLSARSYGKISMEAEDLIKKSLSSKSTDLQQRALEIQSFVEGSSIVFSQAIPYGSAKEDLETQYKQIHSLSFLDGFIQEALDNGAAGYIPEEERDDFGVSLATQKEQPTTGGLIFDPYQTPTPPQPPPVVETPVEVAIPSTETVSVVPEIPVASFGQNLPTQQPSLKLPEGSRRRWGPVAPPVEAQAEPPVLHVTSGRLQYSQQSQNSTAGVDPGSTANTAPPARNSERDFLSASLFGDAHVSKGANNGGGRLKDRLGPKEKVEKARAYSTPATGPSILPELDLLDLSDPQVPTTSSQPSAPPSDPFSGLDFANGVNGSTTAPTTPSAAPAIDLDALYGPPQTATLFAPQPPQQTTPMMNNSQISYGIGMMSGIGAPSRNQVMMPQLNKQNKKDDPFKDLLG